MSSTRQDLAATSIFASAALAEDVLVQHTVLDSIAQALVVVGADHRVQGFNRRFVEMLGLDSENLVVGADFPAVLRLWAQRTEQEEEHVARAIAQLDCGRVFVDEFSQCIEGRQRWCQMFHNPLPDGGFVRTFSDITDKREAEQSLQHERELLKTVMANMAQGLVVVDAAGIVTSHNQTFREIFRFDDWLLLTGRPFADLVCRWAHETGKSDRSLRRALERLELAQPYTFEMAYSYGDAEQWTVVHHNPLPEGGFVRTFTDITERKRLEAELRRLAEIDPLTGLANRRSLMGAMHDEIARSQRYGSPLSFLMIDLDHFKRVNDSYGHAAGDEVLRNFAQLCRESLRAHDRPGRLGGEEFAILLPEVPQDGAWVIAERLREKFAALVIRAACSTEAFACTFSAGLAEAQPGDTPDTLLSRADSALYRAKEEGRNRVVRLLSEGSEVAGN